MKTYSSSSSSGSLTFIPTSPHPLFLLSSKFVDSETKRVLSKISKKNSLVAGKVLIRLS
jgi:hypothetical protein